jgi:hypothetical protein
MLASALITVGTAAAAAALGWRARGAWATHQLITQKAQALGTGPCIRGRGAPVGGPKWPCGV